ncbi:unnamed protein product [Ceratitis capitata]|uniref:(Mediterranean fruit fly) hypothetical protein n=1 Tax=Ceratitis capitata TaxID=7213 RepID=A0A811UFJ0_CERCA|nr:unnamed protein product [Ceratitis capitata]
MQIGCAASNIKNTQQQQQQQQQQSQEEALRQHNSQRNGHNTRTFDELPQKPEILINILPVGSRTWPGLANTTTNNTRGWWVHTKRKASAYKRRPK